MVILRWIAVAALAALTVAFCLANAQEVAVTWNPLRPDIELPLSIVCLGALVVGFLFGALIAWINGGSVRAERRRQKKYIVRLERQIVEGESEPGGRKAAPPSDIPRLEGPKTLH